MTRVLSRFAAYLICGGILACLIAIVTFTLFIMSPRSWLHYKSGGVLLASSPSLSPDGTRLAITDPTTGNGDVAIVYLASGRKQTIISTSRYETSPLFVTDNQILFSRESGVSRHLFMFDLTTEREWQITNSPGTYDVLDIDRKKGQIIAQKTDVSIEPEKTSHAQLISLSGLDTISLDIGSFAQFASDGRIIYTTYDSQKTYLLDPRTNSRIPIANGVAQASSKYSPLVIVADPWEYTTECNQHLFAINYETAQRFDLGDAHSVAVINSETILGFEGFQHKAFTYDIHSGMRHPIVTPEGVKEPARPCGDGYTAYILVHLPNDSGEAIYRFDSRSDEFSEILVLPRLPNK
jgi:hypothetical protein